MKEKLTFVVKTSGTTVTLFIFNPTALTDGERVKLKRDPATGNWTGAHELNPGTHGYSLVIRAGKPRSDWSMSIQRVGKQPLQRTGSLNAKGDGGRVGEISFA